MYVIDTTLGHGGLFNWLIDVTGTVEIRRRFVGGQITVNLYRKADLDQLTAFVAGREWTALASDVQKLHHGTEKEGLGQFLKETLGMSVAAAQGASQLAALFVRAGVWEDNGRRRGMAFRCLNADWQGTVESYYEQRKRAQSGAQNDRDDQSAEARKEEQQLYLDLDAALEVEDSGEVRAIVSTDPDQDWWDKLEELEDNLGGLIAGVPERSLPEARGGE